MGRWSGGIDVNCIGIFCKLYSINNCSRSGLDLVVGSILLDCHVDVLSEGIEEVEV